MDVGDVFELLFLLVALRLSGSIPCDIWLQEVVWLRVLTRWLTMSKSEIHQLADFCLGRGL